MDYTLPVARRTRASQDKVYREIFETNQRRKKMQIVRVKRNNGNAREEEEEEEEEEERDSDFEIIPCGGSDRNDVVGDAREETANRRRFDGNGETSGRGSGTTRGTMEDPFCIVDDDDGGGDDDDEDVEVSSESGEGSSDETYEAEAEDDEEAERRGGRRSSEEREGSEDGESDEDEEGEEEEEEKKKRERRKEKRPSVSSEKEKSDRDSDDAEFWMICERSEEKEKEREKEKEKEKAVSEASSSAAESNETEQGSSADSGAETAANAARRRTRSQSRKMAWRGTASRPISLVEVEEEEEASEGMGESCSEDEEERLRTPAKKKQKCADGRHVGRGRGSGTGTGTGTGKAAKGRKSQGRKDFNVIQILLDSMSEDGKGCLEELASGKKEEESEVVLPLKFTFTYNESDLTEKSDYERELDTLWSDFHISLACEEIGSSASNKVECESELDEDTLCEMGKHRTQFIDEEIGIICKNCSAVLLEIQYVLPSFVQNSMGRLDFGGLGRGSYTSFFDELGHQEGDCEALSDSELLARAKTVWDMIPGVREDLYKHQREGFEFIWKHMAGGIQRENFENIESFMGGRGCIISHAPGTGKSRLTIVFLQSYMKLHPRCLPVIIAPCNMLLTWEEEFKKWKFNVPFHNLNLSGLSGKENEAALSIMRRAGGKDNSTIRMVKLYSWKKGGSVLGVSYNMFEKMAGAQKDELGERIRRFLLDLPGLVVLDEGHIPRNNHSLIWQALLHVKTQRRILLSGTPFQNNFDELFNTMRVVNPKFSETEMPAALNRGRYGGKRESQMKARRDWNSLTKSLGKDADSQTEAARLKQIKSVIDPFVHIHRGDVLEEKLKGLRESIVFLKPSGLQNRLLQGITLTKKELLQLERAVSLISVHPSLSLNLGPHILPFCSTELESLRSDPNAGCKMKFLIGLIRFCAASNERVLVFSQFLDPLSLVMEHLKLEFAWDENEILYIDGKRDMKERQSAINIFNNPKSAAKVLLVSTKAGGEGINLVGASRVVLLDVVWNPSVEKQATRRAYRIGQEKFVYVYHLIASGTREEKKYSSQATKARMSKLVFSSSPSCTGNHGQKSAHKVKEDKILDMMVRHERLQDIFEKILVKNKDSDLVEDQAATPSVQIFEREI